MPDQTTAKLVYFDPRTLIENPNNPRASLGDLVQLAESIRVVGVLEPLIVMPSEVCGYMGMFGRRRRAAAIEAEVASVPCGASRVPRQDSRQIADMRAENLHRADLTAVEEAEG